MGEACVELYEAYAAFQFYRNMWNLLWAHVGLAIKLNRIVDYGLTA